MPVRVRLRADPTTLTRYRVVSRTGWTPAYSGRQNAPPRPKHSRRSGVSGWYTAPRPLQPSPNKRRPHRAKQKCGQLFRYAIATGRVERDISADLRGALVPVMSKNHAAITDPAEIGALLRAIDS
jgi:hypothetical protein